jgi:hypothetical protein
LIVAISLVVSVNIPQSSRAQTAPDAQKEKEKEQRLELEKKTLALLNEIASAAWSLKLPENRIFITAGAADLLWTFDEKRARNLYWEALNSISSLNTSIPKAGETLSKTERGKIVQAYFFVLSSRQKILRQVARRDSQLALEMLRATRQIPPAQLGPQSEFGDDRRLEQEIAGEIAARDPAQALQIARQTLAKGLTFESLNLLQHLLQSDSEKATQFAGDIITKLQTTNVAMDVRASSMAFHLLEASRTPEAPAGETRFPREKVLSLSDDQRRQVVEILTNAALGQSANSHLLAEMAELMPEVEQFFPERRAALERKLAAFNETLSGEQRVQNSFNSMIRHGRQEDLVRSAAAADAQTRQTLYQQAAVIAVARGNTDSFRDFVNKEVSDSGERRKIFDFLDDEEISASAGRKQLDHLRKLLPKIERKEERARVMAELAVMMKEKGEDEEAATLLDEAATLIKTDLKDEKQTNALLTLLCAYALIDPAKAFALAERTVDRANSQISFLMLLDRVVKSGAVRKNEILLEYPGIMPLDFLVFKYGKGVAALAKTDFNRTRALADRFERSELRLMAQLLIVKGLLQPQMPSRTGFEFVSG